MPKEVSLSDRCSQLSIVSLPFMHQNDRSCTGTRSTILFKKPTMASWPPACLSPLLDDFSPCYNRSFFATETVLSIFTTNTLPAPKTRPSTQQ